MQRIQRGLGMRKRNKAFIVTGLLLISVAICLIFFNEYAARRASQASMQALQELNVQMEDQASSQPENESAPSVPAYILDPDMEMPTREVDDKLYIGVLEIPALALELPVISAWSNDLLQSAPCRYKGSAYQDDLIIAAHNYEGHFGRLNQLHEGDAVAFTDVDGNLFSYTVSRIEELSGTAVEQMESGEWDLTLFTCTLGGRSRVTVRCSRVSS